MALTNYALASLSASASAGSTYGSYVAGNLIDGTIYTYWCSTNPIGGKNFTIDLGVTRAIEQVGIYQDSNDSGRATSVKVECSNNTLDWTDLGTVSLVGGEQFWGVAPTSARYWKFTALAAGSGGWVVNTAYVLGGASDPLEVDPDTWRSEFLALWNTMSSTLYAIVHDTWGYSGLASSYDMDMMKLAILGVMVAQHGEAASAGVSLEDIQSALDVLEGNVTSNDNANYNLLTSTNTVHLDDVVVGVVDALNVALGVLEGNVLANDNANYSNLTAMDTVHLDDIITSITNHDGYSNSRRDAILAAIAAMAAVLGTLEVGKTIASVADAIKSVADLIKAKTDNLPASFPDYTSTLADLDADLTNISDKIDNLPLPTSQPSGYPGLGSVTLSAPVGWSGPAEYATPMDGCLIHITTQRAGTGHQDGPTLHNWMHAGWLCFLDDQGYADEVQYLNIEQANYCPKRLATASGLLLVPRLGSSGTMTPWTRNA